MCTRRRTREAPVGDGNRANDAQLGMPTGQQQGSAQEKYRLPGQPTVQQRKEAKIISTHGEHIEQPRDTNGPNRGSKHVHVKKQMNLSWAPSRPGSRNTISKQQKGGKKTPGMTGLAETTPRPSEALFLVQRYRVRYLLISYSKHYFTCSSSGMGDMRGR